jgi:hypothetical protein
VSRMRASTSYSPPGPTRTEGVAAGLWAATARAAVDCQDLPSASLIGMSTISLEREGRKPPGTYSKDCCSTSLSPAD